MLKLFTGRGTIGLACEIALEESGAPYEVVRLNFAENEQRKPEYLALNPKSRVPALVCDQGVITETPAILGYVAEAFPQAGLAPLGDVVAMARLLAFNSYLAILIFPVILIGFMTNVMAQAGASYGRIAKVLTAPSPVSAAASP